MPAWGLINDSPFIYAGQKLIKGAKGKPSISSTQPFSYKFRHLVIFDAKLRVELQTPAGGLWKWMEKQGNKAVLGAKRQVGVKTGELRNSIHKRHLANFTGQYLWIGSTKSYALAHHEGTRPHTISPTPPRTLLRFSKGSRVIYTPMVNHPGTKPNKYLSSQLRHFIG